MITLTFGQVLDPIFQEAFSELMTAQKKQVNQWFINRMIDIFKEIKVKSIPLIADYQGLQDQIHECFEMSEDKRVPKKLKSDEHREKLKALLPELDKIKSTKIELDALPLNFNAFPPGTFSGEMIVALGPIICTTEGEQDLD